VPFYHREIARTIEMHVRAPRPTLESRRPELAGLPQVAALVGALLEIDREARPASADVAARILGAALAHDLDREAADVVQRATLAIGSNMMPELADPSRAVGWQPGPAWPERGTPGAATPAVAPVAPPSGALAPAPRSAGRAALAAVAAAAVAGGVTIGTVRWLRPAQTEVPAAATSDDAEIPGSPLPSEATLDVRAVVEPLPSAASPAPAGVAELPIAPQPPAPTPAIVTADVERPALAAERTKAKRRRPEVAPTGTVPEEIMYA
jgi:hypothetical protein